jgi:Uma2 family endonuclease
MAQVTKPRLSFEEYLSYDDGTDQHYEFEAGKLVEIPPESPLNSRIARFFFAVLLKAFSEELICHKDTEIAVLGSQVQTRLPDLMLLSEQLAEILNRTNRGTIALEMPPPELIVEVVSPGLTNQNRDYRFKRSEYAARGVPEYWAIDPEESKVTLFSWVEGFYESAVYKDEMIIPSRIEVLRLTAKQVLNCKQ